MSELDPALYQDLIGTPYKECGRDAATGLDCFGLVIEIYRRQGIEIPDPYGTASRTHGQAVIVGESTDALPALFGHWQKNDPCAGAMAVFSRFGYAPDHAGIFVTDRLFIHAIYYKFHDRGEIVVSDYARPPFIDWFMGAYVYTG